MTSALCSEGHINVQQQIYHGSNVHFQWRSEGWAWPGTYPAKVHPTHVTQDRTKHAQALVLLAQWLNIQQVPGQYTNDLATPLFTS